MCNLDCMFWVSVMVLIMNTITFNFSATESFFIRTPKLPLISNNTQCTFFHIYFMWFLAAGYVHNTTDITNLMRVVSMCVDIMPMKLKSASLQHSYTLFDDIVHFRIWLLPGYLVLVTITGRHYRNTKPEALYLEWASPEPASNLPTVHYVSICCMVNWLLIID